jgi:hypothetical protein
VTLNEKGPPWLAAVPKAKRTFCSLALPCLAASEDASRLTLALARPVGTLGRWLLAVGSGPVWRWWCETPSINRYKIRASADAGSTTECWDSRYIFRSGSNLCGNHLTHRRKIFSFSKRRRATPAPDRPVYIGPRRRRAGPLVYARRIRLGGCATRRSWRQASASGTIVSDRREAVICQ